MKQLSMAILISNDAHIFTTLGCLMTGYAHYGMKAAVQTNSSKITITIN